MKEHGWRIRKYSDDHFTISLSTILSLPDGMTVKAATADDALLSLCLKYAEKYHPSIRYSHNLYGIAKEQSSIPRQQEAFKPSEAYEGTFRHYHQEYRDMDKEVEEIIRKTMFKKSKK